MFAIGIGTVSAQTKTTKRTTATKAKTSASKKAESTSSASTDIRYKIELRLRDSAAAASATKSTTVINGITVNTGTKTTVATSVNGNVSANANAAAPANNASTTTGGNSVTNIAAPVQGRPIPGTIPVTQTNPADVPGKPITQEQTRNTATDPGRTQMNAINGNQAASAAQNPDNTAKNFTNMIGESQWGTNQVGENQWTPPNNIIAGFTRDFPTIRGASWTRDNMLNTFSVRYKNGDFWSSSVYSVNGEQLETRTEIPLTTALPQQLVTFKNKQSALVDFSRVSRLERPGREPLYEVRLSTGRIAYVNGAGVEVSR